MPRNLRAMAGIGLFGAALFAWPVASKAQFASPQAAVKSLYGLYAKGGPGFSSSPGEVRRYLEPALGNAWFRDKTKGENRLDYDPFVQGQDYEVTGLSVRQEAVQGDRATVRAQFRNFGKPTTVTYRLTRGPDGWRIRDVVHNGQSVRRILRLPE